MAKRLAAPYARIFPNLKPDLINLALFAVLAAQKTHDASMAPFDSYARRQVNWRIGEFLSRQRSIVYNSKKPTVNFYHGGYGYRPSVGALCGKRIPKKGGTKDTDINSPIPMESPDFTGTKTRIFLECEDPSTESTLIDLEEAQMNRKALARAIQSLSPRDRDIFIARRLVETPETLEAIGRRYGISLERVRQLENQAADRVVKFLIDPPKEKVTTPPLRVMRLIRETEALAPAKDPADNVTRTAIVAVFGVSRSPECAAMEGRIQRALRADARRRHEAEQKRARARMAGLTWAIGGVSQ